MAWLTPQRLDRRLAALLAALLLLGLGGCAPQVRVKRDGWGDMKALADAKAAPGSGSGEQSGRGGERTTYTILLERFSGGNRHTRAQALARRLAELDLPPIDMRDNSAAVLSVTVGQFPSTTSQHAQSLLRNVRAIEIDGKRPFAEADFITAAGQKLFDPFDLAQFSGQLSLRVAYYDARLGSDFKAAAEAHARRLREEGHQAYYYHGPNSSIVTVGLFEQGDLEQREHSQGFTVEGYGPRIRGIQEDFPDNLINGARVMERGPGGEESPEPSVIVRVP